MVITVQGGKSVRCQLSNFVVTVDPAREGSGNIALKTKTELPIKWSTEDTIYGPGEYEISGIKIRGISLSKESTKEELRTAYTLFMDDLSLCFLGEINADLDESTFDKLGTPDIVFVSDGKSSTSAKRIANLVKQLEAKIVIPLGDSPKNLAEEMGLKPEKSDKLVIKKKDIEESKVKLIWLNEK